MADQNLNQTSPGTLSQGSPQPLSPPLTPAPSTPSTAESAPAPPTTSDGTTVSSETTTANSGPAPGMFGQSALGAPPQPSGAGLQQGGTTIVNNNSSAAAGANAPKFTVVATSVNNTPVDYGELLEVDATAGHLDVDLPLASDGATSKNGNTLIVKNVGTQNTVGLRLSVGDGIDDGVTSLAPGQFIMLVSNGVDTFVDVGNNFSVLTLTGLKVGAYNAQPNQYVQMDSTAGNISVTLPPAADAGFGGQVWIKNKTDNVNTVTVLPSGADTIDGGASALVGGLEFMRLVSDGVSDWMVS